MNICFMKMYNGHLLKTEISQEFLGKANVFAPIVIYFILILIFSTIEGTWKFPQKMTQELGRYRVSILQRLVTDDYGERPAGGNNFFFKLRKNVSRFWGVKKNLNKFTLNFLPPKKLHTKKNFSHFGGQKKFEQIQYTYNKF